MKALRFHGQKDIRLEQVEVPKCGKDQVKVRDAVTGDFVGCDAQPLPRRSSRPFVAFVEQVLLLETSISLRCFAEHHRPA